MSARGLRMNRSMKPRASTAHELSPTAKPHHSRRLSARPSEVSDASFISAFSGASSGPGTGGSPVAMAQRKTLAGGEAMNASGGAVQGGTMLKSTLTSGQYVTGHKGRVSV